MKKIQITTNHIIDVFRNSPLFKDIDDEGLEKFANISTVRKFEKDEPIFLESDPVDLLWVVASGRVKVFKSSPSGKIFTLMVAVRGDPIISVNPFRENIRIFSSMALDEVTAICFEPNDFVLFVREYTTITFDIISVVMQLLNSAHERIMDLIGEQVEQRLINVLHMLLSKFGPSLSFTSEELAGLAGTTTETTLRMLARLRRAGIIRSGRGKVIISDEAKLRELSRRMFTI